VQLEARDELGYTALMYAAETGKNEMISMLLDNRAKLESSG